MWHVCLADWKLVVMHMLGFRYLGLVAGHNDLMLFVLKGHDLMVNIISFTKSEALNRLNRHAAALLDPILRSIYTALLPNFSLIKLLSYNGYVVIHSCIPVLLRSV